MLFGLFNRDKNKTKKKRKEQIGDKIITKSAYEVMSEKEQEKIDSTCPECGKYHALSGGFISDNKYTYHECYLCKCKWKVRKK